MTSPAAVVFDNLSDFARECLSIADEAVSKSAALEKENQEIKAREALVLTKVAEAKPATNLPVVRVAHTVDRLIKTAFVKRANRSATIDGIRNASREELFEILEKLAAIAICPVSAMQLDDDGDLVEKAGGSDAADDEPEDVWTKSWRETNEEFGRKQR